MTVDPTCLRCGYDLRRAPADAACPECGLAVHRSIGERFHPDDCPPRWVRRIAVGSLLLLVSYVGVLATIFIGHAGDEVFGFSSSDTMLLAAGWFALMLVVHLVANVLLIANDPNRNDRRGERYVRWGMLYAGAPLLWMGVAFGLVFSGSRSLLTSQVAETFVQYFPITFLVLPALSFERMRQLAVRLSRPRLAEHIRIVAIGMASGAAATLVCLATLFDVQSQWTLIVIATALAIAVMFVLWGVALLFFITPKFFASARAAKLKWRLADASRPVAA